MNRLKLLLLFIPILFSCKTQSNRNLAKPYGGSWSPGKNQQNSVVPKKDDISQIAKRHDIELPAKSGPEIKKLKWAKSQSTLHFLIAPKAKILRKLAQKNYTDTPILNNPEPKDIKTEPNAKAALYTCISGIGAWVVAFYALMFEMLIYDSLAIFTVFLFIALILNIVAIALASASLDKIKESKVKLKGRGMALPALIISSFSFALVLGMLLLATLLI